MPLEQPIRRIAVIGTGVIEASWAAQYLARGLDVVATDPAPNAEATLRNYVDEAWGAITELGLSPDASRDRLTFVGNVPQAVSDADLIQENGPERSDFEIKPLAGLDETTLPGSIIASSSSGLTMSVIQPGCKRPERCAICHPFNTPHMIPLVEVVGGAKTSQDTIERIISFYAAIGKKPIRLRKEVAGHVANRLQAALQREIVYLIEQGVIDVADADTVVSWGPGLRWGLMRPNMLFIWPEGPARIGHLHAAEPVLLGLPFDTKRAAKLGLVTRVVPDSQLLDTAIETARRLTERPASALQACKRPLTASSREDVEQAMKVENDEFSSRLHSTDTNEAIAPALKSGAGNFPENRRRRSSRRPDPGRYEPLPQLTQRPLGTGRDRHHG